MRVRGSLRRGQGEALGVVVVGGEQGQPLALPLPYLDLSLTPGPLLQPVGTGSGMDR